MEGTRNHLGQKPKVEPPPKLVVRPARGNDAAGLAEFIAKAWLESGPRALGFAGANPSAVTAVAEVEFLRKRLASPMVVTVVAEAEGVIVGTASVKVGREGELLGVASLRDAGVEPGRLVRKVAEVSRKRGCSTLKAKAWSDDPILGEVLRMEGFTQSGRGRDRTGDFALMMKRLGK